MQKSMTDTILNKGRADMTDISFLLLHQSGSVWQYPLQLSKEMCPVWYWIGFRKNNQRKQRPCWLG